MKLVAALVFVLLAASAATFFVTGLEGDAPTQETRTSPLDEAYDYYVQNMRTTRFAADGSAVSQLRAERVTHFPEDDRADLVQPEFMSFDDDAWQVSASTGTLSPEPARDDDRLELAGTVELRKPLANGDFYEIDTSELTVFLASEEAFSEAPVVLRTRNSRLNGNGMQARLAENEVQLNDGNGTHVPATNL
ncbi:MAG: LPS export ABC transporter periplasmic protein LptC [Pseudomonadota bacterium]|nr:LPS export ABC transporter periplasmic protein LptC [Pseudomonadota bacterium]